MPRAVPLVEACQAAYPALDACSFDRGFHSPANRTQIDAHLTLNALCKKGYRNAADRAREKAPAFRRCVSGMPAWSRRFTIWNVMVCAASAATGATASNAR